MGNKRCTQAGRISGRTSQWRLIFMFLLLELLLLNVRQPWTKFPKIWHNFPDENIRIKRNKLIFNEKLKKHFLVKLKANYWVCEDTLSSLSSPHIQNFKEVTFYHSLSPSHNQQFYKLISFIYVSGMRIFLCVFWMVSALLLPSWKSASLLSRLLIPVPCL